MTHIMDMMDKMVLVTYKNYDGSIVLQYEGKVFDINVENEVLWVERFENGESYDYYDVALRSSLVSVTEIQEIEEVVAEEIKVNTYEEIKEIKAKLMKAIRYDDNISISVKIYDSYGEADTDLQAYDVEINYYIDGEYEGGYVNQTFYGLEYNCEKALKQADKRAKAVLRTVKGWFKYDDDVVVNNEIEVYHV